MSNLNVVAARGLEVGDKVLLVGAWIMASPRRGRVHVFQGTVDAGVIDPSGTPFPTPEAMMWFTDLETGEPCPVPLNYDMGFPCESDLTFQRVETH